MGLAEGVGRSCEEDEMVDRSCAGCGDVKGRVKWRAFGGARTDFFRPRYAA